MSRSRRLAFSCMELLAVITIIGLLLALFLPFLDRHRERVRQERCANNERLIGMGAQTFAANRGSYPGYWLPAAAEKPIGTTWPLTLAEYLDRPKLWAAWIEGGTTSPKGIPAPQYWDLMVCPSDAPPVNQGHWLSYVVNCGLYGNNSNPADGVCFDQLANPPGPKVTPDFIEAAKGQSYTLFGSENTLGIVTGDSSGWIQATSADALQYTGFCWQAVLAPNAAQRINGDKSNRHPPISDAVLPDYARPASYHPGGVNVVFCDGHVQFLSEDVAYDIYQALMVTNPKSADFPAGSPAIGYRLKAGDF